MKGFKDFARVVNMKVEGFQEQYHVNHHALEKIFTLRHFCHNLPCTDLNACSPSAVDDATDAKDISMTVEFRSKNTPTIERIEI
ncbi:unnamed protein product [Pseudo-nitzschia multistriata]|uniref:Uncharacterized protein n=1 Tax=Pseudo-nitzschia multistriata TaxID=183589 RepID=A0A448Z8Y5_9STRA|nr:unnamed protein product [Pseudo-nitzschia multistriata]